MRLATTCWCAKEKDSHASSPNAIRMAWKHCAVTTLDNTTSTLKKAWNDSRFLFTRTIAGQLLLNSFGVTILNRCVKAMIRFQTCQVLPFMCIKKPACPIIYLYGYVSQSFNSIGKSRAPSNLTNFLWHVVDQGGRKFNVNTFYFPWRHRYPTRHGPQWHVV